MLGRACFTFTDGPERVSTGHRVPGNRYSDSTRSSRLHNFFFSFVIDYHAFPVKAIRQQSTAHATAAGELLVSPSNGI